MAVKSAVKRLCAALVACVVMWYTLITAPVFRVGAIDQGSGIASIGTAFISYILTLATEASVFSPVVAASLGLALPLVVDAAYSATNPGVAAPVQLPKSIPTSSFYGDYYSSSAPDQARQVTFYSYTWDYSAIDTSFGVMADTIVACEDYSIGVVVAPDDDWVSSSSRSNMSIQLSTFSNTTGFPMYVAPSFSASDSSGVTPVVDMYFIITYPDGSGFQRKLVISGNSYSNIRFTLNVSGGSARFVFDRDTFQSDFNNAIGSTVPNFGLNVVLAYNTHGVPDWSKLQSYNYPSLTSPIYTTEQAINYYDNSVRPYVISNYSESYPQYTDQFITYQEFYDSLDPVPSETTTPGTGVIIIDPFTLPPEWVQSDVVELDTDHYEVPFESMVADPFDYLVSPYTETVTETVRGATKSVPISPPTPHYQVFPKSGNVQETAVGFVNLAYTLLNRSGLDYVIGIAVFGLCVSLLVL